MNCKQCGSDVIEMVDQSGGVTEGPFVEKYECVDCGANGEIRGNAETSPAQWKEYGPLYNEH